MLPWLALGLSAQLLLNIQMFSLQPTILAYKTNYPILPIAQNKARTHPSQATTTCNIPTTMVLLSFILGIVGNITALLGLVSPMPTFWAIMKKGSTGSFSAQPYLFSLLAGLFWTYYGILKRGGIFVVTISATSCAFQVFYLSIYVWFGTTAQRRKTSCILLVIAISYLGMIVSTMLLEHGDKALMTVGILCTVTSVFSTAAPLTIIHKVVKTGSVQYMPFTLSLGLFLNGACWLAYAVSLKDMFITIPNAIGVSLSAIQLVLYTFYRFYGGKCKAHQAVADETSAVVGFGAQLAVKAKQCDSLEDIEADIRNSKLAIAPREAPALPALEEITTISSITI